MRRCRVSHTYQVRIKDVQQMAFTHILYFILLTMPSAIHKLYNDVTLHHSKDLVRRKWENLTLCIVRILWFANDAGGFYIYSLPSKKFRREFLAPIPRRKCYWLKEEHRYLPRFINVN
ncbi:unnamed protein product [Rotaria sp. Silwood2]|nr:unnamed protein product [Rotaria sp. Silwood2]